MSDFDDWFGGELFGGGSVLSTREMSADEYREHMRPSSLAMMGVAPAQRHVPIWRRRQINGLPPEWPMKEFPTEIPDPEPPTAIVPVTPESLPYAHVVPRRRRWLLAVARWLTRLAER